MNCEPCETQPATLTALFYDDPTLGAVDMCNDCATDLLAVAEMFRITVSINKLLSCEDVLRLELARLSIMP